MTREAYSHEVSSAGFWPGSEAYPHAAFYSYAYPTPAGFERARIEPEGAEWSAAMGEWLLPYERVRAAPDAEACLLRFLQSTYRAAADLAHWTPALECAIGVVRWPRAVSAAPPRSPEQELLRTLAHELRTPLGAILGWSKVLLAKHDDPARLEHGLEAIARSAQAQARLLDDVLDMSRLVAGTLRLELQPSDVGAVLVAAVEAMRPAADAKSQRLNLAVDATPAAIAADPHRLQQAIGKLLDNAVKFTPSGGTIDVRLEPAAAGLEISVRDSGIGIEPERLSQLLAPRRPAAAASTARADTGLGVGLAIARRVVELHGGSLRVISAGSGRGATFVIALPRADATP